jgi:peptidoglycan/xylan/chitin deacetylase (PgdA/CDA1 family)
MFFDADIKGDRLPPKTLCLTYDDGPGPHTEELGRYLHEQGIGATFFVLGRHAEGRGDLLDRLRGWGHLVGNHTYDHPGLVSLALSGGDVVGELLRADRALGASADGPVFFRAPYGNWREKAAPDADEDKPTSVVAEILNRSGALTNYVGPVNWDVCAEDWECWRLGLPAAECARRYLEEAERVGRGIVLMHDGSEDEEVRARNGAFEATRLLVPALREQGYSFVRLDAVPQAASAAWRSRAGMRSALPDAAHPAAACAAQGTDGPRVPDPPAAGGGDGKRRKRTVSENSGPVGM